MNPSVHTDDARFLHLLERWLSGEFTRSDERELHALLEADPFRREAWEGFAALPDEQHGDYLDRLRRRLRRNGSGRRLPLGMWMAAAAVFLALVAAVYFLPDLGRDTAPPLAQTQQTAEPGAPAGEVGASEERRDVPVPETSAPGSASAGSGPEEKLVKDQKNRAPLALKAHPEEAATPAATAVLPQTDVAATLPARPVDTAPVSIGVPDEESRTESLKKNSESPAGPASHSNVHPRPPINPAARTRQTDSTPAKTTAAKPADAPVAAPQTAGASAQPDGGWDAFHRFMRQNARLPEAARNQNVSGRVRLQFTVGPDGKPANVQVVQGLGFGCDEEAMRLIRLFQWAPVGAEPVIVEIPFVR